MSYVVDIIFLSFSYHNKIQMINKDNLKVNFHFQIKERFHEDKKISKNLNKHISSVKQTLKCYLHD